MVQDIRTIGLPALQSFHAVARHGGISAAADHLGMAKSGVSRHVAQLEEQLNVRLLERGARSVRLTPVGAKLDLRIRSILAEVDLLGDIAREESGGVAGQVTVAATPEFGSIIATRLFPALRARHPDLNLVMRPDYAFEDMQDPGTDLAFRIGSFEDDRLVARELGSFRRCLVAAPARAKAANLKRPEDLAGQECMTFRGDRPGATWRFAAKGREVAVDVSGPIAVQNFTILMALALEGQGFALLPDFMIVDALKEGRLVRGLPDYVSPSHPVYLTFRPGARRIARIDATIELADTLLTGFLSEPLSPRQAAE